ncbi:MAG: DUF481 domain-containing protein [Proteobacteria bacterium]|nr:DUF481 domain-containing protein [Pseudomonadota bacterium]
MRYLVASTCLCLVPVLSAHAVVPADAATSLKAALATGNDFVIQATRDAASAKYPDHAQEIKLYDGKDAAEPAPQVAQAEKTATPAPATEEKAKNWGGDVELGVNLQRGNTIQRDILAAAKLNYDIDQWRHTFTTKANAAYENGRRTEEDYRFGWQTAYDLDARQYVFGQAEYVNDMFSGYNYRVTEDFGYGRFLIKNDRMKLKAQAGIGGQHTEEMLANGREQTSSEFILKPLVGFDWKINDRLDFTSEAKSTIGKEVVVSNFEAALKTGLAEHLAAKLSFELEHVNQVPYGSNKTDTTTGLKLVYDF